ncbi:MAG: hypothetical protein GY798_35070 [Hyphomicrobiales bacterium]|nr:hypothetical protein [Hyphomicrobiales bacterium]
MAAEDFNYRAAALRWLDGVEPAWTNLDVRSLNALQREPSSDGTALRLANDLTSTETASSAVMRNGLVLLSHAAEHDGLPLTATGNLTRAVVADLIELFEWPEFDYRDAFRLHKAINEPDFMPLYFVRHIVELARLLRKYRRKLLATRRGKAMLAEDQQQSLQTALFHTTFWRADLGYLTAWIYGPWPQHGIGVALWSLSVSATDWQTPERLSRLCCVPSVEVLQSTWDVGPYAMDSCFLRPLHWFGLLEHREEKAPGERPVTRHFYRKAPLFDRFLAFDVQLKRPHSIRH